MTCNRAALELAALATTVMTDRHQNTFDKRKRVSGSAA